MTMTPGLVAKKAIIIHEAKIKKISDDEYNNCDYRSVITVHDVFQEENGPVIGAGHAMSDTDREMLRSQLNGESKVRTGWWPENVLFHNAFQMVWYHPPAKRKMYFRRGKQLAVDLHWPGLIMCYDIGKGFRLFAYAGTGRPTHQQKLYHAPLWNINEAGAMCVGSGKTANGINPESMAVWDTLVFETNFTHSNHAAIVKAIDPSLEKGVRDGQYIRVIQEKAKDSSPFKAAEMFPTGMTLRKWAESL